MSCSSKLVSGCCLVLAVALTGCGRPAKSGALSESNTRQSGTRTDRAPALPAVTVVEGYRQGFAQGLAASKPMLVVFTTQDCPYCDHLMRVTLSRPEVGQLADEFIVIRVSAEQEPEVCRRFAVRAWPTLEFLSPQGVPVSRFIGCPPPSELAHQLRSLQLSVAGRIEPGREQLRR